MCLLIGEFNFLQLPNLTQVLTFWNIKLMCDFDNPICRIRIMSTHRVASSAPHFICHPGNKPLALCVIIIIIIITILKTFITPYWGNIGSHGIGIAVACRGNAPHSKPRHPEANCYGIVILRRKAC